ncbi:hypothetical protein BDV26DRAFT_292284 [Aspergillus bertholletiae]|uniref:Tat pathway signal sequence n=1 Tax=Aspergillus bertholletiae TaxID=1226010 RepID=A0A5N7B9B1_9EURO|nr:hypothetical protein BDV26DRAFT_292284 [Aspergillus bertholletiae]
MRVAIFSDLSQRFNFLLPWRTNSAAQAYTAVDTDDGDAPKSALDTLSSSRKRVWPRLTSVNVYFSVSLLFFAISLTIYLVQSSHVGSDRECTRLMHAYTPLEVAIEYEWAHAETQAMPEKYTGKPTASIEDAWDVLWNYGAFGVPIKGLTALNKSSLDGEFRAVDNFPGGGVAALLETFHQVHCVNLVRQFIYRDDWNYTGVASFTGGKKTVRHHVDHCIDTIRMNIQCLSDVTPYLIERNPHDPGSVRANHNVLRKCRKYDRLVDWVKDNTVFMMAGE